MTELEKYFSKVYDKLETGEYHIESLEQSVPDIETKSIAYLNYIKQNVVDNVKAIDIAALLKYVTIQLDYYTFSNLGNVFISDSDYDDTVAILRYLGIEAPTTNTFQPSSSTWQIKTHSAPQMVGSVDKVFDIKDVHKFINDECQNATGSSMVIFAPKYDGVGICIEYDPNKVEIVSALTRKDGTSGQELIQLIKKCKNYDEVLASAAQVFGANKGFIKGEIVLAQEDFDGLIKVKPYKNRRNGTSGLINTPSNLMYANCLTVIPLVYGIKKPNKFVYKYMPDGCIRYDYKELKMNPHLIDETIGRILDTTHNSTFQFRTDGVVVFIDNMHFTYSNVMEHSVAFKTNSKVGVTKIVNGYISIGRSGKATPMIKVQPCDLNETVVTDVSLSNFNKVQKLNLHENDTIAIESSGDVIPMVKEVVKQGSAIELKFDLKCPICGYNLSAYTSGNGSVEYECRNQNCARVVTGKISNFLDKLGANGISDQLILDVYEKLRLRDIVDFLNTDSYKSELMGLSGWGAQSANNFCNEIERIKSKPITHGEFLGAMGIPGISTKKCKALFAAVDYDKFMKLVHEGKYDRADEPLYTVKGFSVKTIETFMEFIRNNIGLIDKLSESFTLVNDKRSEANIVFTGFRDAEAEKYISQKGIDVSDNINSQTIAVISGNKSSGKTKKAIERNIPVFDAYSAPLTEICDYIIANLT